MLRTCGLCGIKYGVQYMYSERGPWEAGRQAIFPSTIFPLYCTGSRPLTGKHKSFQKYITWRGSGSKLGADTDPALSVDRDPALGEDPNPCSTWHISGSSIWRGPGSSLEWIRIIQYLAWIRIQQLAVDLAFGMESDVYLRLKDSEPTLGGKELQYCNKKEA